MAYVKIAIHAVWGTKNKFPFLTPAIKKQVIEHIWQNAKSKNIYIDRLNGVENHLHCLFYLNADMSVSKAMQLIKGESAYWINKTKLIKSKFEWADEYYAASVSESVLSRVRNYIDNQEEHHKKISFQEECEKFNKLYGFKVHG